MIGLPAPLAERRARLAWTIAHETIFSEPPVRHVRFIPTFPCCNPAIADAGIVWDLLTLAACGRRPGGYDVLNCQCGYEPHAGIEEMVFVSHPDPASVVWEIDARDLATALAPEYSGRDGYVRLVFGRLEYESDVCAMLDALRSAAAVAPAIEELYPDERGMAYEAALALDCAQPWTREPILAPGTVVEFGFRGEDLCAIDGKPDRGSPKRLFPRWSVKAAFETWIRRACRGFAVPYATQDSRAVADLARYTEPAVQNHFFLLRESSRAACDRAGEDLAAQLRACFREGATAPGVEVRYRACDLAAVLD